MKTFNEYNLSELKTFFENAQEFSQISLEELTGIFIDFLKNDMVNESAQNTRYSVEVNYKTSKDQILSNYAKIVLGYVSAALKKADYHVKMVFSEKPLRVLASVRNWDDGGWVGIISFNEKLQMFVISKGYYNKDKKTVHVTKSEKHEDEESAASLTANLKKMMDNIKHEPDRQEEKLKGINLKRGPKT
jgi:hypothetical protein